MHGKHYYPKGALCWFECNQYGDPAGSIYYARPIPNMELIDKPYKERGFKKLSQQQNKVMKLKDKFAKERADTEQWQTKKPRFK